LDSKLSPKKKAYPALAEEEWKPCSFPEILMIRYVKFKVANKATVSTYIGKMVGNYIFVDNKFYFYMAQCITIIEDIDETQANLLINWDNYEVFDTEILIDF